MAEKTVWIAYLTAWTEGVVSCPINSERFPLGVDACTGFIQYSKHLSDLVDMESFQLQWIGTDQEEAKRLNSAGYDECLDPERNLQCLVELGFDLNLPVFQKSTLIKELDLSVRCFNILKYLKIQTLNQILDYDFPPVGQVIIPAGFHSGAVKFNKSVAKEISILRGFYGSNSETVEILCPNCGNTSGIRIPEISHLAICNNSNCGHCTDIIQ